MIWSYCAYGPGSLIYYSNLTHFTYSNLTLHEDYNKFKEALVFLWNSNHAKVEQNSDYMTEMSTKM